MSTTTITSGEVSSGLTIPSGSFLVISSGGTVVSATIDAGGTEFISSGGSAVDTSLSGGWEMISSGAVAIGTTAVGSGIVKVSAGGTAIDTVINSGQLLVSIGGVASGATIGPNGDMYVQAGSSYDAYVSGSFIVVDTNFDLVTPGYASGSIITADSQDIVANSSTDVAATVDDGSIQWVLSTAVASNSIINSGGTLLLGSGEGVAGGGDSVSAAINSGGSEVVSSGGSSMDTSVNAGGYEVVSSGGGADSTIISAGGTVVVSSGGALTGTTEVMSGGSIVLDGTSATGSGTINLDAPDGGATVVVNGSPDNTITGVTSGDTVLFSNIDFAGAEITGSGSTTIDGVTITDNGDTLTITSGGVSDQVNIAGIGSNGFTLTSENGELAFEICFAEGTLIATPDGEVTVESLRAGDMVQTLAGSRPVKWMGHRSVDVTKLRDPESGRLVRVARGAFAENVPHTDLLVTPEHSIFVDGVLVPVRLLLNGATITRDTTINHYTYFHVELEQHGILIANGLTTESYLDTGNRHQFANSGVTSLGLSFSENETHASWADAAAPLAVDPATTQPIWDRLAARAADRGFVLTEVETSGDADLHLIVDGQVIRPATALGMGIEHRYVFNLPLSLREHAGSVEARLVSKATAPADVQPWIDDRRQLGVMVESIVIFQHEGAPLVVDMQDDVMLAVGWWGAEAIAGQTVRWTNGAATLPVTANTRSVEVILTAVTRYLEKPVARRAA